MIVFPSEQDHLPWVETQRVSLHHPPHRHFQSSDSGCRRRESQLPLEGLRPRRQATQNDGDRRGVPASLYTARATAQVRPVSAFPASSPIGARSNFCPSASSCWRTVRRNVPSMEIARQRRLLRGVARTAAALWYSSRNLPLSRSVGDRLTERLSLTVRNRYRASKLQCATARALQVCAASHGYPLFEAKHFSSNVANLFTQSFRQQDDPLDSRNNGKPLAPKASSSIQYP